MNLLFKNLQQQLMKNPDSPALISGDTVLSYQQLHNKIIMLEAFFLAQNVSCIGLYMDNCIEWIVADLAATRAGVTVVPVPLYFSTDQIEYLISNANVEAVIIKSAGREQFVGTSEMTVPNLDIEFIRLKHSSSKSVNPVAKVTYTSGSTGQPKGVCLSMENIDAVCQALADSLNNLELSSHLCVMPLATLLENVAGVYLTLMRGGAVVVPVLEELGFSSNSSFDINKLHIQTQLWQPDSVIVLPHILKLLTMKKQQDNLAFSSLRFIAVGGGKTSSELITLARDNNLPVYEGYGLSECASVVSLNLPNHNRPGSVGRALPHVGVRVADDGEIVVSGQAMIGYLGNDDQFSKEIYTGDLGFIDEEGYLYISGRKKNTLVSSFGRNISPEWVESSLMYSPAVSQVAVFGEARPALCAVIVSGSSEISKKQIQQAVNNCNEQLPDYARIQHWVLAEKAFSRLDNTLTDNGRVRRKQVYKRYCASLDALYI